MLSASCGAPVASRDRRAVEAGRSRAGRGGRFPVLGEPGGSAGSAATVPPHRQRSLRIGGGASAVLWFTSKGPACISAWPWRKEPRAAVRLSLPVQVQARVTEGKGGERGKETPCPPYPAPLPGVRCPPSLGACRHPGAVGAAAAGKGRSAPAGHAPPAAGARRGSLPQAASRHRGLLCGMERRLRSGGAQREREADGAAGRLRSPGLPPGPGAGGHVPGKGRPAWTGAAEGGTGPRSAPLGTAATKNCRARFLFIFFLSVFVSFSLPVTFLSLLPDKFNKRWKFCVCVCVSGGEGGGGGCHF